MIIIRGIIIRGYIKNRKKRLLATASNSTDSIRTNGTTIKTRKQKWEVKQLHGFVKRLTGKISHEKTWTCLQKENLKREVESLLIAVQNNAILK